MKVKELLTILEEHKERDSVYISFADDSNLYQLEDGVSIFLPEDAIDRNIYTNKKIGSIVLMAKGIADSEKQ